MAIRIKTFLMVKDGTVYKRANTGEIYGDGKRHDLPRGAVFRATWYENEDGSQNNWTGPDGQAWFVVLPQNPDESGVWHWHIDGPASNCTLPDDKIHKCWCRHGEAPDFTVDKNGVTCQAGGGSIWVQMPNGFHGFLRDGYIVNG